MILKFISLFILFNSASAEVVHEFYQIVRIKDLPVNNTYILLRNIARLVLSAECIKSLNYDPLNLKEITQQQLLDFYNISDPLPAEMKWADKKTPDEAMRLYMLRSKIFNGDVITKIETIGPYMNPSIGKFRNRLFMVAPRQTTVSGALRKQPDGTIEFRWVNHSNFPFYTETKYLGVANEIEPLNEIVRGEDPRMVIRNDSCIQIFYTSLAFGLNRKRVGVTQLNYVQANDTIEVVYHKVPVGLHTRDIPLVNPTATQKNWSPFLYKDDVYFVQTISPMIVVRMQGYGTDSIVAHAVSQEKKADEIVNCVKGEFRGGTNAIRLNNSYLAFYHTKTNLPWDFMPSYLFGAYTFSLEPPFRLLSLSPTPIMPAELYTGPWQGRFIDYIAYPMHLFLEGEDTLYMSMGRQDRTGMLVQMSLKTLLATLVDVRNITPFM